MDDDRVLGLRVTTAYLRCNRRTFRNLGTFHNGSNGIHVFHLRRGTTHLRSAYEKVLVPRLPASHFGRTILGTMGLGRHFVPPCRAKTSLCVHPLLVNANTRMNMHPTGRCLFMVFMAPMNPCFGNKFTAAPCMVAHGCSHTTPLKANACGMNNGCTTDLHTDVRTRRTKCSTRFCLSTGRGGCVSRYNTTGFFNVGGGACVAPLSASVLPSVAGGDLVRLTRSVKLGMRHHPIPRRRLTALRRTNTYNATTIVDPVRHVSSPRGSRSCVVSGSNGPNPVYAGLCRGLHTVRCNSRPSARK